MQHKKLIFTSNDIIFGVVIRDELTVLQLVAKDFNKKKHDDFGRFIH